MKYRPQTKRLSTNETILLIIPFSLHYLKTVPIVSVTDILHPEFCNWI